jgi:DNA-directed RNA polymerase subunit RPC12/RpoP
MARYQNLGTDIKVLQEKLKASLERQGYKIERVLTGETSFLMDYKKPGMFGAKESLTVKGVPDDFMVSGISEDNQEAWFIVEDAIIASAKNPQAFKSRTETAVAPLTQTMPVPPAVPTPTIPQPPTQVQKPAEPPPTNCSRCGAPFSVTQEDLVVTCRYCGFTMTVATREEIKKHSMLENHLFAQQAAEAAKKYMDKGIFRVSVSRDASITDIKLRFVPFWVFSANANTAFRGTAGTGVMGEIHQAQEAVTDKRASGLAKFGKLVLAGAKAYAETQQKDRRPHTVAYSFGDNYVWPTLARRTMISEINYYDVPATKKIPFDAGKIPPEAEFLGTELNEEEAKMKVRVEVEAKEKLIASGKVDSLEMCNTSVVLGESELVHAPVWFVHYSLKGENYVIVIDGCEGKVLGGGRPLFKV